MSKYSLSCMGHFLLIGLIIAINYSCDSTIETQQHPFIVAGKFTPNDNYYTSNFKISTQDHKNDASNYGFNGEKTFDIDNDGIADFTFIGESYTGLTTQGSRCRIRPTNKDYYLSADLDTVVSRAFLIKDNTIYNFDSTYVFFSPNLFSINDTISTKCNLVNTEVNLWSINGNCVSFPYHSPWNLFNVDSFEKYIGFAKMNQNGKIFGYMRIKLTNVDDLQQMSIIDYAYNKK